MPHSRFVDSDGILITTLSGVVTLNEFVHLENDLPNYIKDGCIYELVIHSDDVEVPIGMNDSNNSAKTLKIVMNGLRNGAIAFVSKRDYIFGLCRRMQMLVDNELVQINVFRNEETARKWLNEMKSYSSSDSGDI
jgi:hypothetical protein